MNTVEALSTIDLKIQVQILMDDLQKRDLELQKRDKEIAQLSE